MAERPSTRRRGPEPVLVRVGAGSRRLSEGLRVPHAWTEAGMVTDAQGTGAHLLHLSVAVCVLNDTYREAARMGLELGGVLVSAQGGYDDEWTSTGIGWTVEVDGLDATVSGALVAAVEEAAEIPRALRAGIDVSRGDTP